MAEEIPHAPPLPMQVGDFSYADDHGVPGSGGVADQRRWDAWARLTQPLLSAVPMLHIPGNHESETQPSGGDATFASYNARYPLPTDPLRDVATSPNWQRSYLGELRRYTCRRGGRVWLCPAVVTRHSMVWRIRSGGLGGLGGSAVGAS